MRRKKKTLLSKISHFFKGLARAISPPHHHKNYYSQSQYFSQNFPTLDERRGSLDGSVKESVRLIEKKIQEKK